MNYMTLDNIFVWSMEVLATLSAILMSLTIVALLVYTLRRPRK